MAAKPMMLLATADGTGDVEIVSTGNFLGKTTVERAGDKVIRGEHICLPDGAPNIKYVNGNFVTTNHQKICAIADGEPVSMRFLFHMMTSRHQQIETNYLGTTIKAPYMPAILDITYEIPPLPIQHIVVSMLDRLDSYVNGLSSGLPAEIEARQKQYEWWRDALLGFKEKGVS